ncbi:MAG: Hsp20/alpha crystallin family protein [Phycisphaerales bacterium]|nr:Hsp20/alpha crystallin family protein [Phycisphaerales bacterium]
MALPTRVNRSMVWDPFMDTRRELDTMLGRLFTGRILNDGVKGALATYAVDVREDTDHIYVEAELPGYRKEDVDITLENQMLTITAERKHEQSKGDEKKGETLLRERSFNRYQRSFTLPPTVDESKCDAKLADGVLTITLDKREESKPRKITVQ